jgi:hypothetical protein
MLSLATAKIMLLSYRDRNMGTCQIQFDDISYQFAIGLLAGNQSVYWYTINSEHNLPIDLSEYTISRQADRMSHSYDKNNDKIAPIFKQGCLDSLSSEWKLFIESRSCNDKRYTCITTNGLGKVVYKFNHLDFLHGLVNSVRCTGQHCRLNDIIVFDKCRVCCTMLRLEKLVGVDDIAKETKKVLSLMIVDLINIIIGYCTEIPSIINIDSIRVMGQGEYPTSQYTYYNVDN